MKASANHLTHHALHDNWQAIPGGKNLYPTQLPDLMLPEEVTPPDYVWEKISQRLDAQVQIAQGPVHSIATKWMIALFIAAAAAFIAASLRWILL
jgi:hypothetical protein